MPEQSLYPSALSSEDHGEWRLAAEIVATQRGQDAAESMLTLLERVKAVAASLALARQLYTTLPTDHTLEKNDKEES